MTELEIIARDLQAVMFIIDEAQLVLEYRANVEQDRNPLPHRTLHMATCELESLHGRLVTAAQR